MAVLLLALVAGCSAGGPTAASDDTEGSEGTETSQQDNGESDDNDGRAFDSTDDAVITAVEAALSSKNAKAQWDGSTLRVSMDGSASDPTAALFCSTIDALVADSESGIFVYSDGEVPCD